MQKPRFLVEQQNGHDSTLPVERLRDCPSPLRLVLQAQIQFRDKQFQIHSVICAVVILSSQLGLIHQSIIDS